MPKFGLLSLYLVLCGVPETSPLAPLKTKIPSVSSSEIMTQSLNIDIICTEWAAYEEKQKQGCSRNFVMQVNSIVQMKMKEKKNDLQKMRTFITKKQNNLIH